MGVGRAPGAGTPEAVCSAWCIFDQRDLYLSSDSRQVHGVVAVDNSYLSSADAEPGQC